MGASIIIIIFTYANFYHNSLITSLPPLVIVIVLKFFVATIKEIHIVCGGLS